MGFVIVALLIIGGAVVANLGRDSGQEDKSGDSAATTGPTPQIGDQSPTATSDPAALTPEHTTEASDVPTLATRETTPARPLVPRPDTPYLTHPLHNVTDYGAKGDGKTDDTKAIQNALDSMTEGGTLVFPAGEYLYSSSLRVTHDGVRLSGYGGAHLHQVSTPDTMAITLRANETGVYGFRLSSAVNKRAEHANYIIVAKDVSNVEIIDNQIESAGILIDGVKGYLLSRNSVSNSTADSIRQVDGATNGQVLGNIVRDSGDDMISMIGTVGHGLVSNVLVEGNDLSRQQWSRGIAVAGGENITIRNNVISHTSYGAGIMVTQEDDYNTYGARNVLIEGNQISHVQTTGTTLTGERTGHAAINISSERNGSVRDILVRNNTVVDAAYSGLRTRLNACNVAFVDNYLFDIQQSAIDLDLRVGPGSCSVVCTGNYVDDEPVTDERCGAALPQVTGYQP